MQNETLVIRINDFTKQIEDGYTVWTAALRQGTAKPVQKLLGAAAVAAYLTANPKTRVEFLYV